MRVRYPGKRAEPYPTSQTKDIPQGERTDEKVSSSTKGTPASNSGCYFPSPRFTVLLVAPCLWGLPLVIAEPLFLPMLLS